MSGVNELVEKAISGKKLKGRVAIVTGGTRGIGREVCLTLARAGCDICVAGKSVENTERLPGTIHSVAREVEEIGQRALPVQCDVRSEDSVKEMVEKVMEKFGRIDILVNNAGALWWKSIIDTPMKRYDLINDVNSRGTFLCTKMCLPIMLKQKFGHIINMSPPIMYEMLPEKIAYCISKFGMTLIALGIARELKGSGIACNALWPATMVESYATINWKLGDRSTWRKASIISDCTLLVCLEDPLTFSGNALIDEDYLATKGMTDLSGYRCDPNVEPPKLMANL